jgi:hypothetical protein
VYTKDTVSDVQLDAVKGEYPEMEWKMDKVVEGACSKRRGDMHVDLGYLYLIIEIDENQHRGYTELCDKRRYHDIAHDVYSSSGERPIVFLRFNPDEYTEKTGKKVSTPWKRLKTGLWSISRDRVIEFIDRTDILTSRINYYLDEDNIPSAPITVETMFYNGHDPSNPIATLAIEGRI